MDELRGTSLEPPFPFDLDNLEERKLVFLLEQFCLQHKTLSSSSKRAWGPDIIGCVGDI